MIQLKCVIWIILSWNFKKLFPYLKLASCRLRFFEVLGPGLLYKVSNLRYNFFAFIIGPYWNPVFKISKDLLLRSIEEYSWQLHSFFYVRSKFLHNTFLTLSVSFHYPNISIKLGCYSKIFYSNAFLRESPGMLNSSFPKNLFQ